jgi:DNA modification methylase
MSTQTIAINQIKPSSRNARTHSAKQIRQIANSIVGFGFTNPLLVSEEGELIAGHGRYEAAKLLGLADVPVIVVAGLSPAKRRALAIADNKIAENAGWNRERLAIEIPELSNLLSAEGLDVSILGFEPIKIDEFQTDFDERSADPQDHINPKWCELSAVSKPGDLWVLGNHKLLCGSAGDIARLMASDRADMAFLDALANEKSSPPDFVRFLSISLGAAASVSSDGAVHFVCADWRNNAEFMAAAKSIYGDMIDVAVWEKSKADQGSFYRGQLEFIGVFRVGNAQHPNIKRGRHGRSRSNVWHYAGVNSFHGMDELPSHPKPVALIADAIKDCTRKGDIVLDIFSGMGSTIMAAERVGRHARALEVEPVFVDITIRRWQACTHRDARHAESGLTFDEIAADRAPRTPSQDHGENNDTRIWNKSAETR